MTEARRKCPVTGYSLYRTPTWVDFGNKQKALSEAELDTIRAAHDPEENGFDLPDEIGHPTCANQAAHEWEPLGAWHSRNRHGRYCEACTTLKYHIVGRPDRFATRAEVEAFIHRLDRG